MTVPVVVKSLVRDGGRVHEIDIEAAFMRGFSGIQVLGSLTEVVKNGRERARSALESLGIHLPAQKLVINFAPADVRVDGSQLDLALAVSLARVNGVPTGGVAADGRSEAVFAAEMTLDGALRPVPDIVALALGAASAGVARLVVAAANLKDLAGIDLRPMTIVGFDRLDGVLNWLAGDECSSVLVPDVADTGNGDDSGHPVAGLGVDFRDMELTPELIKVAVVAAAGGHHMLLRGTPGSGKTMFASRLPGILPQLAGPTRLKCLELHSIAGCGLDRLRGGKAPFRAPHHSASMAAIVGSGFRPGELALAHGGVLFLDELPEFRRDLLESLREPLESGVVHVSRVQGQVSWPAEMVLIAAANNCPCGWFGSCFRQCRCSMNKIITYQNRISGPLLDRIDLHINLPERGRNSEKNQKDSRISTLDTAVAGATSMELRRIVAEAAAYRSDRHIRLAIDPGLPNARIPDALLGQVTGWSLSGTATVAGYVTRNFSGELLEGTSSRGLGRAVRVARTLADVDRVETVGYEHLEQALLWQAGAAAKDRGDVMSDPMRVTSIDRSATWNQRRQEMRASTLKRLN